MSRGRWTSTTSTLIFLSVLRWGVPAQGQAQPQPGEHGAMAERYYMSGQYKEAIEEFKAAYLKEPLPIYLYNIAQSQRQIGRKQEALTQYERFLHEAQNAQQRARAQGYVTELRAQLAAEQAAKTAVAPTQALPAPGPSRLLPQPQPVTSVPVYRRWWFWTAIGGVVVAGVATGVAVAVTRPTYPDPPPGLPVLMGAWQ